MNYYDEIKNKLINDEVYSRVKDYSKERHRVMTYFEIGRLLNEAGGKYGDNIIGEYSKKLVVEVGKKFNRRTLFRMKQFYNIFNNEKVSTMSTQLTWSHYTELLPIKDRNKLFYYLKLCINNNLDVRNLRNIIKSNAYERLTVDAKNKLMYEDKFDLKDCVPNPILIRNKNDIKIVTEKVLHQLILEDIESFMKELGSSFSFIGSEYKIKIWEQYNYIDLLLFNIEFNCYVVVELKVTELKKEYIGQVQVYMNYIDNNLRKITMDKTIGIIIVRRNNKFIMEYCSDKRILAREYEFV